MYGVFVVGIDEHCPALGPGVLVSEPLMEVLAVGLILLASLALQCGIKPWRTQAANLVDAAVGVLSSSATRVVGPVTLQLKGT